MKNYKSVHFNSETFEKSEGYENSLDIGSVIRYKKMETIVKLLAKSWFYGDWKWENPNERVQQMLMQELGYYPFKDEDEMIHHTQVDDNLYKQAANEIKGWSELPKDISISSQTEINGSDVTASQLKISDGCIPPKSFILSLDREEPIIIIDKDGFKYKGELIEDKGEIYQLFKNYLTSSQTEISDDEIEKEAENAWSDYEYEEGNFLYSTTFKGGWKLAIKWYREQLKLK